MTAVVQPNQLWSSMPGWGIVTDLTPPELIAARRLRLVRKFLVAGLVFLMVLLAAGYTYASLQAHSAQSALADEQTRAIQLRVEQRKYSTVTQVRGTIEAVQRQLAGLMSSDVDLNANLGQLRSVLPAAMALTEVDVTISPAGSAAASATTVGTLDTSGRPQIGKVKLTGTARNLDDLAGYVTALQQVKGFVDVLPTSNQVSGTTVQFAVTLSMTDETLSHHFDKTSTGSK